MSGAGTIADAVCEALQTNSRAYEVREIISLVERAPFPALDSSLSDDSVTGLPFKGRARRFHTYHKKYGLHFASMFIRAMMDDDTIIFRILVDDRRDALIEFFRSYPPMLVQIGPRISVTVENHIEVVEKSRDQNASGGVDLALMIREITDQDLASGQRNKALASAVWFGKFFTFADIAGALDICPTLFRVWTNRGYLADRWPTRGGVARRIPFRDACCLFFAVTLIQNYKIRSKLAFEIAFAVESDFEQIESGKDAPALHFLHVLNDGEKTVFCDSMPIDLNSIIVGHFFRINPGKIVSEFLAALVGARR